jgi:hypothetical protein
MPIIVPKLQSYALVGAWMEADHDATFPSNSCLSTIWERGLERDMARLEDGATLYRVTVGGLISLAIGLGCLLTPSNAYAISGCWKPTGRVEVCPWIGCLLPARPRRETSTPIPGCEWCRIPGFRWCSPPEGTYGVQCGPTSTNCWLRIDRVYVKEWRCSFGNAQCVYCPNC